MSSPSSSFTEALSQIVGSEGLAPPEQLVHYTIDGISPQAVVFPATVEQVGQLLELAWKENKAVAPWGGGTRREVGNVPKGLDLVVVLNRLNSVLSHQPADLTVRVEAGITLAKLRDTLTEHGQFLPLDPPLPSHATVGGTLASDVAGPLKWRYNLPRDLVIGLKVIQANGTVTKSGGQVVKNVTGYDMGKLHIGGLGTLGVIVEATFKLVPLPKMERTLWATFARLDDCCNAALAIFQSHITPLASTVLNAAATRRLEEFVPESSQDGAYYLGVRLGGRSLVVQRQEKETRETCLKNGATKTEEITGEQDKKLWRALVDFGWEEEHLPVMSTRISILPIQVYGMIACLEELSQHQDFEVAYLCHTGNGTVYSYWYDDGGKWSPQGLIRIAEEARERAKALGGSLIIERCPTAMKGQVDVWGDIEEGLATMRRMKKQYDPRGILNPGRFVGGI